QNECINIFKIDLRKLLFWLRCPQSFFYFLELRFDENFCGRQMIQAEMHMVLNNGARYSQHNSKESYISFFTK
uniref:hypothetical protein n=1 Tax=Bacillus pumilus TaxID=1408 RepID=UPI001C92E518